MDDLLMNRNSGNREYPTYFLIRDMEGTEVVRDTFSRETLDHTVPISDVSKDDRQCHRI